MKKSVILFSALFLSIASISLAAAALPAPPIAMNDISDFFTKLLSGVSGQDLMIRVLLVMLLTTVLFRPAYKLVGEKSGLAFIIAALVSILGIKYLATYDLITGLLLPYGALAIALSAGLPFILIGMLIVSAPDMPATLRKILWGLMTGAFILLWWFRWTDIGDLAYIYLFMGLISAAVLFFLDGTIVTLYSQATQAQSKASVDVQIAQINSQIANLYAQYANATGNHTLQTSLRNQIRALEHTRNGLLRMRAGMP